MNTSRTAMAAAAAILLTLTGSSAAVAAPNQAQPGTVRQVTHEQNDRVPKGASWTEHYFPSSDGSDVELHADVLLPKGLAKGERVPVILSAGSYFGHSGELGVEGWKQTGPSDRFNDFINGTKLFDRGYAFVMVDVRGFGGSTGCLDFAGPGEQADVKAAIDWAAKQPWSTGAVGMYGKSYDAITGLVGNNLDQDALKAVVAQEPIWDLYRNIRSNGVPRSTITNVSSTYNTIATLPQLPDDTARYRANAGYERKHPECLLENTTGYQTANPDSAYWKARDLAAGAKGSDTPLFVTQGFLEWNTEPEAIEEYLANHRGPQRGWLGQWDHVRGNDRTADGRLAMGRKGWFAETMSFYDQYLKGIEPTKRYPNFAIQDSTGSWRAQESWPVADRSATLRVGRGSYVDDGGEDSRAANSFVKWSEPVSKATRVTGTPRVRLDTKGNGNVMVKLYDVAADGTAVLFDEQVAVLNSKRPSSNRTSFDLKSTDWTLPAGHSLAVEIGTIQSTSPFADWIDTPSRQRITVHDARLTLATDDPAGDVATAGKPAPYLDIYRQLSTTKLRSGKPGFTVPGSER